MNDDKEMQPKVWFVRQEGLSMGPFTGAKIRSLLLDGELTLDDQISTDKKRWISMVKVPEVVPLPLRAEAGDSTAQAGLQRRRQSEASSNAEERRVPWMAIGVVLCLIGGVLGLALWVGMPKEAELPQCNAAPAPGVNWSNCLLSGIDVGSASLAGATLNNVVLREARLSATNLSGADLRYADLSSADLRYADLQRAILLGASLQAADLRGGNLAGADLRYANLSGSLIENANFDKANLSSAIWYDGSTCAANSVGRCLKP
jgi:hypothetical protein